MKYFLPLIFFLTSIITICSQDVPDWVHNFDSKVSWSFYNSKTSIYYIFSSGQLKAFDCLDKKILFELEAPGLERKDINASEEYPIAWLNNMRSRTKGIKTGGRDVLLNMISGEILFDSDLLGGISLAKRKLIFDQGIILVFGKKNKKWVMALAEFGAKDWSWIKEVPVALKKISLNAKTKKYPVANENHILVYYATDVFTIDRKTGEVLWQQKAQDIKFSNYFAKRMFLRTDDPNFYLATKNTDGDFEVMAHDYATGEKKWDEPLIADKRYSISGRQNDFFIRTDKYFDFINYKDGKRQSLNLSDFEFPLGKVFLQEDAYLVSTIPPSPKSPAGGSEPIQRMLHFDWLNKDLKKSWSSSVIIKGKKVTQINQSKDRLLVLTDKEAAVVDVLNGKTLGHQNITEGPLVSFNSIAGAVVMYDTLTSQLQFIDLQSGQVRTISEKVQFEHKKGQLDKPVALISVGNQFALLGSRNLWLIGDRGEIVYQKYVPAPNSFNWKKSLALLGGLVAGVFFEDELKALNYELYKEGLIDPEQFWNNAWGMAVYQKVGSAAVGMDYVDRMMPDKERLAASQFFQDTWLVTDKLEKGKFGLKIIDIPTGEERKAIWLAKNDQFTYEIDYRKQGIYLLAGKTLSFYKLN